MPQRALILKIHLYLGLVAAIFLAILGLTGSIMAFEGDINHWLHPDLWYVTPGARPLPENDLISIVQNQFPRRRVVIAQFFRAANLAQAMQLSDGTTVYVNPYDGTVLGSTVGLSNSDIALGYIHQIHLRLLPDPRSTPRLAAAGKVVVSIAGLILCLLVPTGVTLWWRRKSTAINWKASWFKVFFDAHQAIGIYAALFLLIASLTGIMIGFGFLEQTYYLVTRSSPPPRPQSWASVPVPGATPIMSDEALEIARRAMPNATVALLVRPLRPQGAYTVMMRVPEETSETVHSSVTIDQFSGKVLYVRNYLTESAGYRLVRFNRSIHTGDVLGMPTHIIVSLSSLLLVAMVITGLVIWWKKLAV
ncbi:MAG TPA: PepSY-associated TM helix domain-containing protein [Bryobacteraceae bacterium]|jgi:uncharacterized iron-regulated membrane protein|nr:PepSY-associated TM helix domain-containing protein [Bryobacteraceae bacterium]